MYHLFINLEEARIAIFETAAWSKQIASYENFNIPNTDSNGIGSCPISIFNHWMEDGDPLGMQDEYVKVQNTWTFISTGESREEVMHDLMTNHFEYFL